LVLARGNTGRHCEERSDVAIQVSPFPGLPRRYAPRNDDINISLRLLW